MPAKCLKFSSKFATGKGNHVPYTKKRTDITAVFQVLPFLVLRQEVPDKKEDRQAKRE
jgi:hypothetical protein